MVEGSFGAEYSGKPAANYERFFVPAIGAPLAAELVRRAMLQPGERVLDVASGTGVVARLAAERVGATGAVAGLDPNAGMLAVARSAAGPASAIEWHEASAEAMPLPDGSFDVVLCQMGLQFVPDQEAALREMRRVLAADGRVLLNLPGPTPRLFTVLAEGLAQHVDTGAARFVDQVFSLHDTERVAGLLGAGGFREISIEARVETLRLPPPEEFFWQYVHSTPIAGAVAQADEKAVQALERAVLARWREHADQGALELETRVVVAAARA